MSDEFSIPKIKYPATCKNCGAQLTSPKCEYCGAKYTGQSELNMEDWSGEVTINEEKIKVFVEKVDYRGGNVDGFYDSNGNFTIRKTPRKRMITLMEI